MDLKLRGKNCILTGGSRGIGRAIALALAEEGVNVAICARNNDALEKTGERIRARGVKVFTHVCDVGDSMALAAFLEAAREALGGVDLFVHNASALAVDAGLEAWRPSLDVDLMGAVNACARVVPWMEEAGGGSILFVSSIAGIEAVPLPDFAYTTVKAALIAYAKKLAVTHASRGVRVNALAPGPLNFRAGCGTRRGGTSRNSTKRSSTPSQAGGWGRRRRSRTPPCSCFRRARSGSPVKRSPSTAVSTAVSGRRRVIHRARCLFS